MSNASRQEHSSAASWMPDMSDALQVLEGHSDEIWHVTFSHDGRLVGSASKDGAACIWRVKASGEAVLLHTLQGHTQSLSLVTFSPDDSLLLTCGSEPEVRLVLSRQSC